MPQLVWLVTGCSSGIGEELVHQIIARGDKVIATARRPESIKGMETYTTGPDPAATILQVDVTAKYETHEDVVARAIGVYGRIDVLVNNAGYVLQGVFEDLSDEQILAQFETNVFGTLRLTRAILPHFRERRAGTVVFISSLCGLKSESYISAYASSKFALEAFAESIRDEVTPFGIKTLVVEPGRFRTKLLTPGNITTTVSIIPDYVQVSEEYVQEVAAYDDTQPGDPKKGVAVILDVVRGEGVAEGRQVPFRLPLGTDCFDEVKEKLEKLLKEMNEWEKVIKSTDH